MTLAALLLSLNLLSPSTGSATIFIYHLQTVFSGTSPSGSPPWVDALFEDVSPGTIRLTISNVGITGDEFNDETYFNLRPTLDPTSLTFAHQSSVGNFDLPVISTGTDSFKADGDGKYDFKLDFSNDNPGMQRFGIGEQVVYLISGIPGLTVADFTFLSQPAGGHGPFYAAAHIQGIPSGEGSGWIQANEYLLVPEPSATLLGGIAFALVALRRLRS